jgi:hypothetical protein
VFLFQILIIGRSLFRIPLCTLFSLQLFIYLFIDIKVDQKEIHIGNLYTYLVLYMVQSRDHVKYIYILKFNYRHHGMCLIEWNRYLAIHVHVLQKYEFNKYIFFSTSVNTEMCCPKGKCGCQYFILLT